MVAVCSAPNFSYMALYALLTNLSHDGKDLPQGGIVEFSDGFLERNPDLLSVLSPYIHPTMRQPVSQEEVPSSTNFDNLTKAQIIGALTERSIAHDPNDKKAELVKLLVESEALQNDTDTNVNETEGGENTSEDDQEGGSSAQA